MFLLNACDNMKSIQNLLRGAVDYAGLFPPAGLDMATAVGNYHEYGASKHSWALGRFVLPVSRLGEFEAAAASILSGELEPWRLSAIVASDPLRELQEIAEFNQRQPGFGAVIDTVEIKVSEPNDVNTLSRALPESLDTFFEVSAADPTAVVGAIARVGRKAKIRTGGVSEALFPSIAEVAGFIDACRRQDVAFKATAGLHHALRSDYRLTYEADSASATMHGFINVFLAACFRHAGVSRDEIETILGVSASDAFVFDAAGVTWGGHRLTNSGIESARHLFLVSFGSCSFEEPIDELRGMQLL